MHHTLALYLLEILPEIQHESETYTLDLLTSVEAILENPRPILYQQERRARDDLMARLKAERVPYEERMQELEKTSWPRPNETFIRGTFELFRERHPWVRDEDIRPKGIAREMAEGYASFDDFVKRFPDDKLCSEALFWGGESYRMGSNVPLAFQRYNRCRWDFPESDAAKYARGRLALPEMLRQFEAAANLDQ